MPYVEGGSGADVFTMSLAAQLGALGHDPVLQAFPKRFQFAPWLLRAAPAPVGTDAAIANSWNAAAFAGRGFPMIAVEHLCVFDPAYDRYRTRLQRAFHGAVVRPAEKRAFRRAAISVAVSKATASATEAAYPGTRMRVVLNGIDTEFFKPGDAPSEMGKLLFVGNPTIRKGSDLLIPILDRLGPAWTLDILPGREAPGPELGHPRIRILPRQRKDGVRNAMQRAAMLLFPTRLEGLPLVALEAMACGLPVAASRASSLPEAIDDGRTGILANLDDPADFAARIEAAAGFPGLLDRMGIEARKTAVERFCERRMAASYDATVREAVEGRRSHMEATKSNQDQDERR